MRAPEQVDHYFWIADIIFFFSRLSKSGCKNGDFLITYRVHVQLLWLDKYKFYKLLTDLL